MDYLVRERTGYFEVKTSGPAEVMQFAAFLDELIGQEGWVPGSPFLVDHSDLDAAPMTVVDIMRLVDSCLEREARLGPAKVAIVAPSQVEFGMCRMWGAYIDGRWEVHANIFRSREEAIGWLLPESAAAQ